MPERWTAEIIGQMHLNNISAVRLSKEVGWNPKYLSAVLNGHRNPRKAYMKLTDAISRILNCDKAGVDS